MRHPVFWAARFFILCAALAATAQLSAEDLHKALFAEADKSLAAAREANAPLLAPKSWGNGMKAYDAANEQVKKGESLEKIKTNLATANAEFTTAVQSSRIAETTFGSTLKARQAAEVADAPNLATEQWDSAEKEFNKATNRMESGSASSAKKAALEANEIYRSAELSAVKAGILGQAWALINKADKERATRYAPETFEKARSLANQAEKELSTNRYDTSKPAELAAQAEYEARHGFYLAGITQAVNKKDLTVEQLVLDWETPVIEVANVLGISADLSQGYGPTTETSVSLIADLRASEEASKKVMAEAKQSERQRQQLAQVEALFSPSEARIVREGNDLIIRLIGLSFPSGKAIIETQYYGLLKQVQQALKIFPNNKILIEGHTDSTGSNTINLQLSERRAEAVSEYLIANLGMPKDRVSPVGYGKNQPIATNDTAEGRARNRRIDVVIKGARNAQ